MMIESSEWLSPAKVSSTVLSPRDTDIFGQRELRNDDKSRYQQNKAGEGTHG
jgi:hypothetical protein